MTVAEVAAIHQQAQKNTAVVTTAAVMASWSQVDPRRIVDSWAEQVPSVSARVAAGQMEAAERGARYVPNVTREQGIEPDPEGRVRTARLAGVASDGRPLETLLGLPAVQTVNRIGRGQSPPSALAQGRKMLGLLASTQVFDAGRVSTAVGMTADRNLGGYRRKLRGDTNCARCIILAGKFYRWNAGFLRHPACDCEHVPSAGTLAEKVGVDDLGGRPTAGELEFDPRTQFQSMTKAEQDRVFTKGGAEAIRHGADMNQVVNARRGMRSTRAYGKTIKITHVGTSSRARAAKQMARELDVQFAKQGGRYTQIKVPRLMPEQIMADARGRDDAIRLLRRFGYIRA